MLPFFYLTWSYFVPHLTFLKSMHSLLLRSLFPFLLVTSFISINFELCLCQPYSICKEAISCGGIGDISYPFWGVNRPNFCGQPGFELRCLDDVPVINMSNISYRILEMNSSSPRTIKVARQDYWKTLCPSSFANTSINFSLFNYSSGLTNVTFYYGCDVDVPRVYYSSQVCNVNNGSDQVDTGLCKVNVTVPVFSTAAIGIEVNPTTLQDAIDGGFKLEIKIDNDQCNSCEGSGGRCGHNRTTGGFTCYCQDQASSATICNSTSTEPSGANDRCNSCVELGGRCVLNTKSGGFACFCQDQAYASMCNSTSTEPLGVNDQCHSCEESGGRCGLNTTSGGFACFCQDQAYATICDSTSIEPSGSLSPSWKIGISAGVSGTIVAVICIICISRKRKLMCFSKKDKTDDFDVGAFIRNYGSLTPKRYSYSDVKKMTISFRDKIGKGGYGTVYRGKLPDGCLVAVKVLSDSKGNGEEFINEVASIGRTSHVNVVTLFGFCYERDKRALIYEFMPNGSLDNFIHKQGSDIDNCRLGWKTLSEIAVGVARGLEYLHRGCNTRILHLDIKPQNILLDKDFCPKIADFGLAKLCKAKESIVSMLGARGTAGYIAPEVFSRSFGGVSHKSDVYSYGMLVLEMVGARKNLDSGVSHTSEMFPHYIYKDLELENNANVFGASSEEENEIARKMVLISMWCIQTIPSDRPSMSKVVEMLEGPIQSLQLAPKPSLFSHTTAAENSMSTNQQSDETS